jgi:cell division transport system permease protein
MILAKMLYFFKGAWRNICQCPLLCLAAVGTVAVSLMMVAFFGVIFFNFEQLTSHWGQQVQLKIFLEKAPNDTLLAEWRRKIEACPEVESVNLVSSAEALERFRKRLGKKADLLEGLGEDLLPASLEIGLKAPYRNSSGVAAVAETLRQHKEFSDMRHGGEWLNRFDSLVSLLKLAAVILGGFLLFATIFMIANTIKLTLYARRDELEIMTLVGGTSLFIKMPYIIEGAVQGLLGGLLAVGGAYLIFRTFLHDNLVTLLMTMGVGEVMFLPTGFQWGLVSAGMLLGVLGSLPPLRKFVRMRA